MTIGLALLGNASSLLLRNIRGNYVKSPNVHHGSGSQSSKETRSKLSLLLNLIPKFNYICYPVVVRFSPAFFFSSVF